MARPLKPLIRGGGYYPSRRLTPLVYPGGYTTADGGGEPAPIDPKITLSGSLVRFNCSEARPFVSTVASILPQQDLHGQDAPYPSGGGTNLLNFPNPVTATGEGKPIDAQALDKAIPAGEYTVGITSSAAIAWQVIFKDASNNNVGTFSSTGGTAGRQAKTATLSATASKITIYVNGATTLTNIMMNTGSTAQAFSPYSNICPISGWDAVNVTRTGVNMFDDTFVNMAVASYADGPKIIAGNTYRGFYVRAVGGNSYTISRIAIETNRFRIAATVEEPADGVPARGLAENSSYDSAYSVTVTLPEGYNYIFVYLSNQSDTCTANNYQVQLGSTATPYEPYTGTTIPISWQSAAGTVYGGTLDVTTGMLTATHKYYENAGTGSWGEVTSGGNRWYIGGVTTDAKNSSTNGLCNIGNLVADFSSNGVCVLSNGRINLCGSLYSAFPSVDDLKTYLSSNPLQLVYELATPLTYQLPPTEVKTLLGENNVWVDSGDIEVTVYGTEIVEPDLNALQSLNILLGNRYVNTHEADEPTDEEALDIILGGNER